MGVEIHPSAIVAPKALLGCNVSIEAFCMVGPEVQVGMVQWFVIILQSMVMLH